MPIIRIAIFACCTGLALLSGGMAWAQGYPAAYPTRLIRILTAGTGGGNDVNARIIAQGISGPLGQQVIVENRPTTVLPDAVARAAPDGHTLMLYSGGLWIQPFLSPVNYDPIRDFAPIAFVARSPLILVVHPSLPVHSVRDLITLAREKPGTLNYTTGGTGSASHLGPELFKQMTGIDMVRVPYKSGSQELADLLSGQVQLTFGGGGTFAAHIKSGKLRGVAVTSAQPSILFPGLPTVASTGVAGYESTQIYGLFGQSKVSDAIIRRLNQETVRYLQLEEARQRVLNAGMEAVGSSPEEFAAVIKADMAKWGKLIKDAGIHED